ncbi:MAG: hypothetical protein JEZ04_09195 [Spirochaetales bacterium]|nr:hypothetical protein [Spirochaetales bacterium]
MELIIEYFGTAASVIVAVSLTQKNIKKLRILNGIGAVAFALYGFMINAWPVFGLNALIALIDLYYLIEMKRRKDFFKLMKIEHPADSIYLRGFLDFYLDDIQKFMPEFSLEKMEDASAAFVLRDMMPVSLVVYSESGDRVEIFVDYALPAYRDGKNSRYFFDKLTETIDKKRKTFITKPGSALHNKYLRTMGFKYSEVDNLYIFSKS